MMIYTKVKLNLEWELTIPMPDAKSVDEVNAEMIKDGGPDAFVKTMSAEVIKSMSTPFTSGRVTSGTVEIVEV